MNDCFLARALLSSPYTESVCTGLPRAMNTTNKIIIKFVIWGCCNEVKIEDNVTATLIFMDDCSCKSHDPTVVNNGNSS